LAQPIFCDGIPRGQAYSLAKQSFGVFEAALSLRQRRGLEQRPHVIQGGLDARLVARLRFHPPTLPGRQTIRIPLELPAGLNGDDTIYGAQGRWASGDKARFRNGRPQVDGGWESLTATLLTGVCRSAFPWTDNNAILNVAFGTHQKVQLWQSGQTYDITPFGPPTLLGSSPLGTTNTSARVDVTHVAHGRTTGDSVKIAGAAAVGGITPNGTFTITVDDVDHYHYTFGSNATSTTTGGGSAVVETPQVVLPAGAADGTGSVGFGTGAYGVGPWGQTSPTTDYFPRTWSFGAWGQQLLASPRNGGLYLWTNNTANRLVAVDNAPVQIAHMLVAPMQGGYMAFALGCNQEADGVFNPMTLRHSAIRAITSWSTLTSTSREYTLTGGGRIVAGRMIGPYLAIWTSDALHLGTYTGALNLPWRFDRVGRNCGLIGPNAVVVVGQTAFWASPDRQFYSYPLGGQPQPITCPIRTEYADNLSASQGDKVVASACAEFEEVRWDYPDARDGYENSRFVRMVVGGPDAGAWSQGVLARSAYVDAGPSDYPIAAAPAGNVYYHEKGHSADGASFSWRIKTAAQLLDPDWRLLVKQCWPDFKDQIGPITVTVTSLEHPQDDTPVTYVSAPMAMDDASADLWISGRYFQVEFSGAGAPTNMRLGKPVFEAELAGKAL
jgi:hypothetical protein